MLVCPQCQFENPDQNRFCQKCGTSLTERSCPTCSTLVPLAVQQCPNCGKSTATRWRALLLPRHEQLDEGSIATAPLNAPLVASDVAASKDSTKAQYLDFNHRYQLLDPLPMPVLENGEMVTVVDCQPFAPSVLELLDEQSNEAVGDQGTEALKQEVPAIAHTYLTLQQELFSAIPTLHDAWEQEKTTVLLLEDRSGFLPLADFWQDEIVSPFQLLHLLHQITVLWSALEAQSATRSLLYLDNLKVDEDQLLCLQRLYVDPPQKLPQLTELGEIWKTLFGSIAQPELIPVFQVIDELRSGKIDRVADLQGRLEAIAEQLQPVQAELPTPVSDDTQPELEPGSEAAEIQQPSATSELPLKADPPNGPFDDEDPAGDTDDAPTIVLPMKLVSIEDAGCSDVGRKRDHNEDCFSIYSTVNKVEGLSGRTLQVRSLYVLCDGMGGHAGGEVASALAVETLQRYFQEHWQDHLPSETVIRQGILEANKAIYDLNQQDDRSGSARMGTTLVLLLVQDTQAIAAHVGDSRLYRFSRRQGLEQLTTDHEVGQREIQRGVETAIAYARPDAYQLTQALGPRDENFVVPEVQFLDLNEDVLLLLCSDGLTDNQLLETHWKTHVEPLLSSDSNLEQGANQLIDLANQYNGHDNITAIAIRIKVRPNLEQLRRGA